MNDTQKLYDTKSFLLMTLDPVHIGTGGNRLGRVDNSIVREPGTRLPKIPGTSLHGAIRQYAAYRYESPRCAGQGEEKKDQAENKLKEGDKGHCCDSKCPICYTFGYMKGKDVGQSGQVSIGDARLLLFPVYSLAGPVWVTCPNILGELKVNERGPGEHVRLPSALQNHKHLNLGWLMLEKANDVFNWPDTIKDVPDTIKERSVLISDKLFSQVVNSNLEVRTSVSIDPNTGAAKEGHLFTYEAIPRATLLWLEVVQDNCRDVDRETIFPKDNTSKENTLCPSWKTPLDVVRAGLKLTEHLGIGGMGTRGFGRVKLLNGEETA